MDCVIGQDILQKYFDGFNHQENKLYFGSQWNKQYYIALHPYNITTSINKNNNYNNNNDIRINPIQQQQNNNNLCEEEIIPSMIISDNDLQQNITSIASTNVPSSMATSHDMDNNNDIKNNNNNDDNNIQHDKINIQLLTIESNNNNDDNITIDNNILTDINDTNLQVITNNNSNNNNNNNSNNSSDDFLPSIEAVHVSETRNDEAEIVTNSNIHDTEQIYNCISNNSHDDEYDLNMNINPSNVMIAVQDNHKRVLSESMMMMMNGNHPQQIINVIDNDDNNLLMNDNNHNNIDNYYFLFYIHNSKPMQKYYNNNHIHIIIKDKYYRIEDNYDINDLQFYVLLLYDVDIDYENYSLINYKKRKRNKIHLQLHLIILLIIRLIIKNRLH